MSACLIVNLPFSKPSRAIGANKITNSLLHIESFLALLRESMAGSSAGFDLKTDAANAKMAIVFCHSSCNQNLKPMRTEET